MELETLLKLSIMELKELPIEEFHNLSKEERIRLITTKECEGSCELFGGLRLPTVEESKYLNYLTEVICPELILERNLSVINNKRRRKKNLISNVSNDTDKESKSEMKCKDKGIDDFLRFTEYNPSFMQLSLKKRNWLQDLDQKRILTCGFTAANLMEIFEDFDEIIDIYEENSCYSAEEALQDTLSVVVKEYEEMLVSQHIGLVIIIGISPEFEWRKGLLKEYRNIVDDFLKKGEEINVIVVEDDGFFGTSDLYIRLFIY